MKDFESFFIFIVGIVIACALFWGIVTAVKRSFTAHKPPKVDSSQLLQEQRQRSRDVISDQKRLMQEQRQRIRDLQGR